MKIGLNLVGPQVRKWRDHRGWSQETMACKLQLQGWSISRHSLAKLGHTRLDVRDECKGAFRCH